MNPVTIIAEALQRIPRKVRQYMYLAFALLVCAEFVAEEILGYDTGKSDEVLLYVGGLLGVQAGANATSTVTKCLTCGGNLVESKWGGLEHEDKNYDGHPPVV